MTLAQLVAAIVSRFNSDPALRGMCPEGLYWRRGRSNSSVAATGTATMDKMSRDDQHNTGHDHPAEYVFQISTWLADSSMAFDFVERVTNLYEPETGEAVEGLTILVTDEDVIDSTDQTWQGMVELTITVEVSG